MWYFSEFCHLVRCSVLTEETLNKVDIVLSKYLEHHKIFQEIGVRDNFSVPCLHSVMHYKKLIRCFGAPNNLCSSITESKHIEVVKKPWRCSNWYNALGQMLNARTDLEETSKVDGDDSEILDSPRVIGSVRLATTTCQ